MGVGTPERLMDELVRQGKRDLTVIANDNALPGVGIGKLVSAGVVRKTIASHIGLNPETQKKMIAGAMEVELVPQGTLIERIRAAGFGLGGILTPTGVGTVVEEGKRKIEVDGRDYLLETPLRADFALVQAFLCDYLGNLTYALTTRNFNPLIAMAADDGDRRCGAHCSGRRDSARPGGDSRTAGRLPHCSRVTAMDAQTIIAKRIAQELRAGMLVNLGIGIPTLVANYVPDGMHVFFQSENGLIGTGPVPEEGMVQRRLTDAGGRPVSALPGACAFDSAMSFGLIRGGHLDMTVLGGLQVDEGGHLANWMIPGKMVPGMGGAMDLVCGAKRVVVAMQHTAKGKPKILRKCTLPLTSVRPVDLVVTEMAVISFAGGHATLIETAPGVSVEQVRRRDRGDARRGEARSAHANLRRIENVTRNSAPAIEGQKSAGGRRRQRPIDRLRLREGVSRTRRRAGDHLYQREDENLRRAAR